MTFVPEAPRHVPPCGVMVGPSRGLVRIPRVNTEKPKVGAWHMGPRHCCGFLGSLQSRCLSALQAQLAPLLRAREFLQHSGQVLCLGTWLRSRAGEDLGAELLLLWGLCTRSVASVPVGAISLRVAVESGAAGLSGWGSDPRPQGF